MNRRDFFKVAGATVFIPLVTSGLTSDDGYSVQAAINALPDSGGLVYIAEGTYIIGEPITSGGKNNVTIQGAGWGTVLRTADGMNDSMFSFVNGDAGWLFKDLRFDGNRDNNITPARQSAIIKCTTVSDFTFQNLCFENASIRGLRIFSFSTRNLVEGCRFHNCLNGAITINDTCTHNVISNCYGMGTDTDDVFSIKYGSCFNKIINCIVIVSSGDSSGIQVIPGATQTIGNLISGNTIVGCNGNGYGVFVAQNNAPETIIHGNKIKNWKYGIALTGDDHVVSGNSVKNCVKGIHIHNDGSTITGNNISSCTYKGIFCEGSHNNINGNKVKNVVGMGINLRIPACYNAVIGNVIYDEQEGMTHAIYEHVEGCDYNMLSNNIVGSPIACYGANTIESNNLGG